MHGDLMDELPPGFHVGDSRNMDDVETGSVTLIITSPPYNVDKEYERGQSFKEWKQLIHDVLKECDRVLKDGGRACINVPTGIHRNPSIAIDYHVMEIALGLGWWQRGRVLWLKPMTKNPSGWGSFKKATNPTLRDAHEVILVMDKGKEFIPDGDSGISTEEFMEFTRSEWYMEPESAERVGHPAPFPEELPRRCILLWSNIGDIIVDPFPGSGTTLKVARALGRKAIAYELNKDYIPVIKKRLEAPMRIQSDAVNRREWIEKLYPGYHEMTRTELVDACQKVGIEASVSNSRVSMMDAIDRQRKMKRLDEFLT